MTTILRTDCCQQQLTKCVHFTKQTISNALLTAVDRMDGWMDG